MSWNPNQGQEPNQAGQYGNYNPQQQGNPYPGGYQGYQQQPGYGQQQGGYQQGQYGQQGGYQQPGYQQYGPQGNYQQFGTTPSAASANGPTSMGMDANTAAGLSYLLSIIISFISGIIFFVLEKQNRFVRFHAMQSILLNAAAIVLFIVFFILQIILFATVILAPIGGLFTCLSFLAPFAAVVLSIVLGIMAFQGKYFKLPIIGDYAEKFANPRV